MYTYVYHISNMEKHQVTHFPSNLCKDQSCRSCWKRLRKRWRRKSKWDLTLLVVNVTVYHHELPWNHHFVKELLLFCNHLHEFPGDELYESFSVAKVTTVLILIHELWTLYDFFWASQRAIQKTCSGYVTMVDIQSNRNTMRPIFW